MNAQGEDVVAGIRTPQPLTLAEKDLGHSNLPAMEEVMPEIFGELCDVREKLENHYKDMQDMEFTVQQNKLWMLQTRNGKRTARASFKIAVEMADGGLITKEEAIKRIDPAALDQLLHPTLDPNAPRNVLGKGLPASPGAASAKSHFLQTRRRNWLPRGKDDPCPGGNQPRGHWRHARCARNFDDPGRYDKPCRCCGPRRGRPCVAGAGDIRVDYQAQKLTASGQTVNAGDIITIDGSRGDVMLGPVETIQPELTGDFGILMSWVDEVRTMGVRTNAETPEDATTAVKFGAEA